MLVDRGTKKNENNFFLFHEYLEFEIRLEAYSTLNFREYIRDLGIFFYSKFD